MKKYSDGLGELIHIDHLILECGYFYTDTELNSGYGCKHKGNTDYPGCCYTFSCPVAVIADLTSVKPRDTDLYNEYKSHVLEQLKNGASEDDMEVEDWMIKLE